MRLLLIVVAMLVLNACGHSTGSDVKFSTQSPKLLSRISPDNLSVVVRLAGDDSEYRGAATNGGVWKISLSVSPGQTYQFTTYWYSTIDSDDVLVLEQVGEFYADPESLTARPATTDTSAGAQRFDIDCDGMSNLAEINAGGDPDSQPGCISGDQTPAGNETGIPVPETKRLPATCFEMGGPEGDSIADENEIFHEACVVPFSIGVYEVTFDEYDAFAGAPGVVQESPNVGSRPKGRHPLVYVTFNDAVAYTNWLSEQTGRTYRLPTEVEWEYAARAGTETRFWTGDTLSDLDENFKSDDPHGGGVYINGPRGRSLEVGSLKPNPFGLYDMLGNVNEWTCTHYRVDDLSAENICDVQTMSDPEKPYVVRGANYANIASWARASKRNYVKNLYRDFQLGFRVVLED